MVRYLITRPIGVFMVFIALVIVGFITLRQIPVTLLPDIDIPEVTVYVYNDNFTARQMQNSVADRLTQQFRQCNGVEDIQCHTTDGKSVIDIRFEFKTNTDYAAMEVNEKIDAAMRWLPQEMERPRVVKANVTDIPVFYLNLSLDVKKGNKQEEGSFMELSNFAESVVKKRIEYIPEVAFVDVTGTESARIIIKPDLMKMRSLGLGLYDIQQTFEQNNVNFGTIEVNQGIYQYNIRIESKLYSKREVESLLIKAEENTSRDRYRNTERVIHLKDIAEVVFEPQSSEGLFYSGEKRAISLAVIKQPNTRMETLKTDLAETISNLEYENEGIHFEVTQDQTVLLESSIKNLERNLLIGSILAILVVFLFYQDLWKPLIIGISVPLSLIITLLFFRLFKLSVNIISLSGLILGIGMMIDNSIIVIDNITQHWQRNNTLLNAAVNGTDEIITPLISSILTTVAIFIPLIFISGVAGGLFADQAVAVSIGLAVSFWVSIVLLPVMYHLILKKKRERKYNMSDKKQALGGASLERWYEAGLDYVLSHKIMILGLSAVMLLSTFMFFHLINKEAFPKTSDKDFFAVIDWNDWISLDKSKERTDSILSLSDKNIQVINRWIGSQDYSLSTGYDLSPAQTKMYIEVAGPELLEETKDQLSEAVKKLYPEATLKFEQASSIFNKVFKTNEEKIEIDIYPVKNSLEMDSLSIVLTAFGDLTENNSNNGSLTTTGYYSVEILQERIMLYGLNQNYVINLLLSAFNNYNIGNLNTSTSTIPVFIGADHGKFTDFVNSQVITANNGMEVPLKFLVKIRTRYDYKNIYSNTSGEYISVPLDGNNNSIEKLIRKTNERMKQMGHPVKYSIGGSFKKTEKILKELMIALLVSIILLYFILAAQFESLLLPLIVLIEIPIDISAALIILYIFGHSLNAMSVIGIIVMSGIVINDSILKIDTINKLRRNEKMELTEAIKEGGKRRLRPMIMTSLTTILALFPVLLSNSMGADLQKPFALTILASLGVGTLVSLYFIPTIYWFINRKKNI